ncbi:hypothetical protein N9Y89_00515 [bacterium]|nr:hypothetical protein [bacterium]
MIYLKNYQNILDKEHFGRIFRNNAKMSSMGITQISADVQTNVSVSFPTTTRCRTCFGHAIEDLFNNTQPVPYPAWMSIIQESPKIHSR